ncbi:MAG: hypothetical protein R3357_14755 [Burkholderiales bacterium]|nr:hypothetical protein [Burkholderiales bacterium]
MTTRDRLAALLRDALPPVPGEPQAQMPRSLYRYVWRVSGAQQLWLVALTALVFPLSLAPVELQRRIVNSAVRAESIELLAALGAIYLAALLVSAALKFALNVLQTRIAESVIRVLRLRIARQRDGHEGMRISMAAAEAETIGGFVGESLSFPVLNGGMVITMVVYMFIVEPLIAAVALGFFFPSLVVSPLVQARINREAEAHTRLVRQLGETISDNARGATRLIEGLYAARLRAHALKFGLKAFNNVIAQLGPLSVLLVGGWMVIQGETEVGTIVAFVAGFERIIDPSRQMLNFYRRLSAMRVQYGLVAKAVRA